MLYFLAETSQFMITHSAIGGPWMPELVVKGIWLSLKMGLFTRWSTPAESVCMNLMLEIVSRLSSNVEVSSYL